MGCVSFFISVYRLIDVVMTHSCDRDAPFFIHIPHHLCYTLHHNHLNSVCDGLNLQG